MDHVLLYREGDADRVEDLDSLEAAIDRLRELHEDGNTSGRIFGEVPVRVETVVRISVEEVADDPTAASPPPPAPHDAAPPSERRKIPSVDFVAPSS